MGFAVKRQLIKVMEAMGNKMYKPAQFDKVKMIENIPYIQDNLEEHLLDIIYPQIEQQKYPVILNIHGGGFCMNSKDKLYRDYGIKLSEDNYLVVNINYTLSTHKVFPAQILDVMAAVDFIGTNADKFQMDVNNIFVVGDSAGAYLATLLGCISTDERLQEYYRWKPSISIRAIASNCGLFDFETVMQNDVNFPMKKSMVEFLFGKKNYKEVESFAYSSVLQHVNEDFPPIYIMDTELNSFDQEGIRLEKILKDKGVESKSHIYAKSKKLMHVFHIIPKYKEGDEARSEMIEFFRKHEIKND